MSRSVWLSVAVGLVLVAGTAGADAWDTQTENDNFSFNTENELIHGTVQRHDLKTHQVGSEFGEDEDWYRVGLKPRSSYEVIVDSTSGDIGRNVRLDRFVLSASGTQISLVQFATSITPGLDCSKSLRWENPSAGNVNTEWIVVRSASCTTNCGADDVYDIRFRETTIALPRFNNSGGQVTILIIQNAADTGASGNVYFRNTAGALVSTTPFGLAAQATLVLNTAVGNAAGTSGTMTISHTGRYGDLAVKAVALDPATGFSFDTPGQYRPF
jgi:hypothetical protein